MLWKGTALTRLAILARSHHCSWLTSLVKLSINAPITNTRYLGQVLDKLDPCTGSYPKPCGLTLFASTSSRDLWFLCANITASLRKALLMKPCQDHLSKHFKLFSCLGKQRSQAASSKDCQQLVLIDRDLTGDQFCCVPIKRHLSLTKLVKGWLSVHRHSLLFSWKWRYSCYCHNNEWRWFFFPCNPWVWRSTRREGHGKCDLPSKQSGGLFRPLANEIPRGLLPWGWRTNAPHSPFLLSTARLSNLGHETAKSTPPLCAFSARTALEMLDGQRQRQRRRYQQTNFASSTLRD